ncbi:peptidase C15 [Alteribacter lacisalsi]|uniref:Pyroglutamyl-peptidase I n=1 Tax=Alteribacter lacisalsi TaxID=2045244 RepID=A0A2W0HNG1_9BACI|nr:pyroglutamyl-peptidase I [Alteribacter lacisalsi]PYZ99125.1 peptidase C15 [Alteribacter lacisalsi]
MKILISGFEPFGKLESNPTEALVKEAADWKIEGIDIRTVVLPVVYRECAARLQEEIEAVKPDVVLSLGVAVGRSAVTPERIGINVQHTEGEGKFGDNSGRKPDNEPLIEGGPDGLFATLPNREITRALTDSGIPAQISNSAGTYICNNTLYETLCYVRERGSQIKAGFIHVPATPEMASHTPHVPTMSLDVQAKALKTILTVIREN